jgi:hypothetical protein
MYNPHATFNKKKIKKLIKICVLKRKANVPYICRTQLVNAQKPFSLAYLKVKNTRSRESSKGRLTYRLQQTFTLARVIHEIHTHKNKAKESHKKAREKG